MIHDGRRIYISSAAATLMSEYKRFLGQAEALFSKVDQKLLLSMLQFQQEYSDWEGNVMLKVVYKPGLDMNEKKEKI